MDAQTVATVLGVVVASFALIFTAIQVYLNNKQVRLNTEQLRLNTEQRRLNLVVNRQTFLLKLEEMTRYYDEVHLKLRPGGEWAGQDDKGEYKGPKTAAEWASVQDYMGFFEHLKIMYDRELIDKPTFKTFFADRLGNIVQNPMIVKEKLIRLGGGGRIL